MVCFFETGGRVSPRRARYLFFASPKKSTQKKGDPQSATPSRCYGANLQRGGCGVRRGTRYALARCARTTTASQITKHAREGAHATPQTPRRRRSQKGVGKEHPNIHTGHCCARPSLRSARRLRPSGLGRAQQWPVWMSGFGFPSGCAEERRFWRIRARVCLSDAKRREFSETPAKLSTAGCPQRSEGTQPAGSLFLGLLSFGEAKESESPAGAKSRPPP